MRTVSLAERTVDTVIADNAAEHMIVKAEHMDSMSSASSLLSAVNDQINATSNTGTNGIE